jgi:gliding motility-associated-like protein
MTYSLNLPGSFLWQDGTATPTFTVTETGLYSVKVAKDGCENSDTVHVVVLKMNLGRDTSYCQDQPYTLYASVPGAEYIWSDHSKKNYLTPVQSGIISLTATVGQCKLQDSILVRIRDCEIALVLPTIFTPNNDGVNDLFKPQKYKRIERAEVSVFNRWGHLVYHTTDLVSGWDGSSGGENCAPGVYFWILQYSTEEGQSYQKTGSVQLQR